MSRGRSCKPHCRFCVLRLLHPNLQHRPFLTGCRRRSGLHGSAPAADAHACCGAEQRRHHGSNSSQHCNENCAATLGSRLPLLLRWRLHQRVRSLWRWRLHCHRRPRLAVTVGWRWRAGPHWWAARCRALHLGLVCWARRGPVKGLHGGSWRWAGQGAGRWWAGWGAGW